MKKSQIAVFGSAFNPPHLGHADVIEQIKVYTEQIILVPSFSHAFGKKMMGYEFRMALLKAMHRDLKYSESIVISDLEKQLAAAKPAEQAIYTFDVLNALESQLNTSELTFVVGPDNADPAVWKKFYKSEEILERWNIWGAQERLNVRSSFIRESLENGASISEDECSPGVISLLNTGDWANG